MASKFILTSGIKEFEACDIDQKSAAGLTPLHFAIRNNLLGMAKYLLEHGANVDLTFQRDTCLQSAVKSGNVDLTKLILRFAKDVNFAGKSDCPPLHVAIVSKDHKMAEVLLQHKADPNLENSSGHRPLYYAIRMRNVSLIELLLYYEAKPNDIEKMCAIASGLAFKKVRMRVAFFKNDIQALSKNGKDVAMLRNAFVHADCAFAEHLLQKRLLEPDQFNSAGRNLLHHLLLQDDRFNFADRRDTRNKSEAVIAKVELLVEHGIDVRAATEDRRTPLQLAAWSVKLVECLIRNGAIIDDDLHISPLFAAIDRGSIQVVEYLIDLGANLNVRNEYSKTLVYEAIQHSFKDEKVGWQMVLMLLENGCVPKATSDDVPLCIVENRDTFTIIAKLTACQRELESMRMTEVYENSGITYWDLMTKRARDLERCLSRWKIREIVDAKFYRELYPLFCDRFEYNFAREAERLMTLDGLNNALYEILDGILPCEVIAVILAYLSEEELEKIENLWSDCL